MTNDVLGLRGSPFLPYAREANANVNVPKRPVTPQQQCLYSTPDYNGAPCAISGPIHLRYNTGYFSIREGGEVMTETGKNLS